MKASLLTFMHCLSPFHPGSGTSVSYIDLPVQREAGTGLPVMQGSGFKGALRHRAVQEWKNGLVTEVFGPEPQEAQAQAGAAYFTDLRLLLFPVRCLKGIFTWVTCPQVLARFKRDAEAFGHRVGFEVPTLSQENEALVGKANELLLGDKLVLEEFTFSRKKDDRVSEVARFLAQKVFAEEDFFRRHLEKNLVVVSDFTFEGFTRFSMEVLTRIRISPETGTVAEGALWNEENVPAESVFYGLVLAGDVPAQKGRSAKDVLKAVQKLSGVQQFGGNATVGRGLVRLIFCGEEG